MHRTSIAARWAFAALTLALLLAGGCGGEPADNAADSAMAAPQRSDEEVQKDFNDTMTAYRAEEDQEKKFQIWFDFLDRNPDGRYTTGTLQYLVSQYYIGDQNDPAAGIAFLEEHMKNLTGERVDQAKAMMIGLYGKAGNVDKLHELADEMDADGTMTYTAHKSLADAAESAKDWDFAIEHAKAAVDLATPEAVKAESGEGEMSEEDVAKSVTRRKGDSLTTLGNLLLQNGDVDGALENFGAAEPYVTFNYVGVSDNSDINIYWTRALIAKGDYEGAMRRIAPAAIMEKRKSAKELFKEAYEKSGSDEVGLDRAIEGMRAELIRTVPQFEAYNYEGNKEAWSNLKGKVTLLSFWFPT